MKRKTLCLLSLSVAIMLSVSSCSHRNKAPEAPKNIVVMIGDGMSIPQITATMIALDKPLAFEMLPYTGLVTTRSANKRITDSAAAGTAIATGSKTDNGMVGMTPDKNAVPSMLERYSQQGKKTGVVVSCSVQHATPAAFIAKNEKRGNYYEIAEYISNNPMVDFMAGGGSKYFFNRPDSVDLKTKMEGNGWAFYESLENLDLTNRKIAVLAADKHMPPYPERGNFLPDATAAALKFLSTDKDGFFLMVEGSQIDFACHNNDSAYMVNEMIDFDSTLRVVLDFAKQDGNTLVVVTADHETGGLTIIDPKGNYTETCFRFSTGSHSPLMVPIFAYGPGAEKFTGIMDNTEIIEKLFEATK